MSFKKVLISTSVGARPWNPVSPYINDHFANTVVCEQRLVALLVLTDDSYAPCQDF
jgi:hypothetical protein